MQMLFFLSRWLLNSNYRGNACARRRIKLITLLETYSIFNTQMQLKVLRMYSSCGDNHCVPSVLLASFSCRNVFMKTSWRDRAKVFCCWWTLCSIRNSDKNMWLSGKPDSHRKAREEIEFHRKNVWFHFIKVIFLYNKHELFGYFDNISYSPHIF